MIPEPGTLWRIRCPASPTVYRVIDVQDAGGDLVVMVVDASAGRYESRSMSGVPLGCFHRTFEPVPQEARQTDPLRDAYKQAYELCNRLERLLRERDAGERRKAG